MNYSVPSSAKRQSYSFIIRLGLIVMLIFFIGFFVFETFSFLKLFEVTVVANPAVNLIK